MSLETRTVNQGNVEWSNGMRFQGSPEHRTHTDTIEIGRYNFDKTKFNIAVLEFLEGEKDIELEAVRISIPETPQGIVRIGHLQFPYEQFVYGVGWSLTQMGVMSEKFHEPMYQSLCRSIQALEKQLLLKTPERNEKSLKFIDESRESLQNPLPSISRVSRRPA